MTMTSERCYGSTAIFFHWLTAGLIALTLPVIWTVFALPDGPLKDRLLVVHRSLGVIILFVVVLRLLWRAFHPAPPLPDELPAWERRAARISHWLIYALLIAMPVTGYVSSAAIGHPISFFGVIELPQLVPTDRPLFLLTDKIHLRLQWALYGLLLLHVGAALRHHFRLRNDVLRGMLPRPSRQ
jgi:cytochrome b561